MAQTARVLVVEDDDSIALAVDFLLTREGYAHDRIATGAGALDRIRDSRPDIVLLDVMLPDVSGHQICRDVRGAADLTQVRILMMSARGSATERQRGLASGADGFIAKPFALSTLSAELRRLLPKVSRQDPGQPKGPSG